MSKIIQIISILSLILFSNLRAQIDSTFKTSDEKVGIAILQLDNNGITSSEANALTDRLRLEIFRNSVFEVMERQKMDEILDEMEFQVSGCTSDECALEIGRLIGVQKMVAGSVSKVGEYFTVSARIIDIETGRMEKTAVEDIEGTLGKVLTHAIPSIAAQLSGLAKPEIEEKEKIETLVKVYSAPGECEVYLNNVYKGMTPLTIDVAPEISHNLRISKTNYSTHQQSITVEEGETKDLSIVLSKTLVTDDNRSTVSQISPLQEKEDAKNKVFRISFIGMEKVDKLNDFIDEIIYEINYGDLDLTKDIFSFSEMKNFNGLSLTSGNSISNYFFLDFNIGVMFSSSDEDEDQLNLVMPFATADLRFHPLGISFLNPYGMVGFGYNLLILNAKQNDKVIGGAIYQSLGLTFGGGLEFRFGNTFGIDVEWNKRNMDFELTSLGDDTDLFKDSGLKNFKTDQNFYKINLNFYH